MSPNRFQKRLLANSIAVILGSAVLMPAYAADEAADATNADGEQAVEVIQVSGIRGSSKANINAKRFSNSVVDVITAEDIGKFPDKNVADSLARISGVGISREFGEGERITIRGSGPNKNRTLLNGQNVATADWFILDNPSRGFNFTLLPSSLVKELKVYKTPQADIDEGSIGGTVVLKTRRPLELEAHTMNFSVQSQYSETSEKYDPQLDGMYSWRNEEQSFGALISLTKQDRTVQREGLEVLGWTDADANGNRRPKDIGNPIFRQDRERETLFASFQYAPSDAFDITLNVLDSEVEADNQNINLLIRPQNADITDFTDVTMNGTSMVAGTNNNVTVDDGSFEWDFINRESRTETKSYDLDFNYNHDDYTIHAQVGHTKAKGGTYNETSWSFKHNIPGSYSFDLTGEPQIDLSVDPTDGSLWKQNWTWGGNKPTTDEEDYAQIDLEFPVEFGIFTSIKTGLKYRDHDRAQGRQAYSWHGPGTSSNPDSNYMADIFAQCPTLADCGQSGGTHNVAEDVISGSIVNQLDGNRSTFMELGFGPNADYAISNMLNEIWDINESISAFYIKGDFEGDFNGNGFRGNIGVRVVETKQTSKSFNFSDDSGGFHTVDREWLTPSVLEWVAQDNDYTEVLPSFNISYDLSDDQVIRFGAAEVMARADFADLASITTSGDLSTASPTGTAGNPFLEPQKATQFDIGYEWYFADASLLSVLYFWKDVDSYRTTGTFIQPIFDQQTQQNVDVTVTKPSNGRGGTSDGIEFGFQQTFGEFGFSANYTYTNAESDQIRDETLVGSGLVEGASENMYNASVFYETETFGVRLMYNYRTEWYKGVHWTGAELWNDSYGQLDFSSSYELSENISLTFEAVNLTDEEVTEYDGDKTRLMSTYQNGRRFVLGANFSF